jgi:hypothetical protein
MDSEPKLFFKQERISVDRTVPCSPQIGSRENKKKKKQKWTVIQYSICLAPNNLRFQLLISSLDWSPLYVSIYVYVPSTGRRHTPLDSARPRLAHPWRLSTPVVQSGSGGCTAAWHGGSQPAS